MIPLSMFPIAITAGNTFILKPSEKIAGVSQILARITRKIGLPHGVFNVVQGGK
jgi:malonate-semialdehyde dehydrogenase (acetylating)/methylmalonate-semialdehyde dehydrogenase